MNGKKVVEKLMGDLLPFAKKMLREHQEFYPFGGWVTVDGEIVHVGAKALGNDRPKSSELVSLLKDKAKLKANEKIITAVGIVFDVCIFVPSLGKKSDAIQLNLDHVDGYSAEVIVPYSINNETSTVLYGDMFAQQGNNEIFPEV